MLCTKLSIKNVKSLQTDGLTDRWTDRRLTKGYNDQKSSLEHLSGTLNTFIDLKVKYL